jgi:hypothetical protein
MVSGSFVVRLADQSARVDDGQQWHAGVKEIQQGKNREGVDGVC